MTAIGRTLRILRLAAGLSIEAAADEGDIPPSRVRALESGQRDLGYVEGLVLSRAYLLCATCFAKHVRRAATRDAGGTKSSGSAAAGHVEDAAHETDQFDGAANQGPDADPPEEPPIQLTSVTA